MRVRSAAWWTVLTALFLWLLPSRLPAAEPPRAPVVVTIVVDQLAAWIAAERLPLLPPTGGFARLVREGLWVREMRYAHAVTDTGPGHAALYTGAPPRASGIFGNEIPPLAPCHAPPASPASPGAAKAETAGAFDDPDSILLDPMAAPVPPDERPGPACGVSLRALRAETLADRLRAAHPDAIIISLSLKDRGATLGGGRRPTAALWFDVRRGRFVTSTAFRRDLPPWIDGVNRWLEESFRTGLVWELEDAAWVEAHAGTPDDQPGEGGNFAADAKLGYAGIGRRFPHRLPNPRALRASPFGDEALFRAAVAALDSEVAGRRPTLLALSLSAHDLIGHLFGPDSWEAWDELHRLDGMLGRFLVELDRRLGEHNYAVVLAADHGSIHMPEACGGAGASLGLGMDRWQRPCKSDGHRLLQDRPS
ncbi:MAG TPA: alkaline phosphatase family protein, partial [Polyangia bacterium]|nr:alkaline phosphatase family protein [Polyangia bacterium]